MTNDGCKIDVRVLWIMQEQSLNQTNWLMPHWSENLFIFPQGQRYVCVCVRTRVCVCTVRSTARWTCYCSLCWPWWKATVSIHTHFSVNTLRLSGLGSFLGRNRFPWNLEAVRFTHGRKCLCHKGEAKEKISFRQVNGKLRGCTVKP